MADNSSRNAFLIHLAAYMGVNAALVGLNAFSAPEPGQAREWWSLYVVAGWGIGVAAHGFAVWAGDKVSKHSMLADPDVRGVAVHLFVYLAVNALLIFINFTKTPDSIWSLFPVIGWGLGLAAHAWLAYRKVVRSTVERYASEQQILSQMQLEQQAAAIAAAIEPLHEPVPEPVKKPPQRRRNRAAAKTAKKSSRKAPAKTTARKKTPAKRKPTAKAKRTSK